MMIGRISEIPALAPLFLPNMALGWKKGLLGKNPLYLATA
jgi:hypothetical protein